MKSIGEENYKKVMDEINYISLTIRDCANSIRFILRDLDEVETSVNCRTDGYYSGLVNIVDQMSSVIKQEAETIIQKSDYVVLLRENAVTCK